MSGKGCKKKKHTPITSEAQQGLMGSELARRRAGKAVKMKGITTKELESHLEESKGKNLPKRAKKRPADESRSYVKARRKQRNRRAG